jgi:mono/diheme cytochrome c family protein
MSIHNQRAAVWTGGFLGIALVAFLTLAAVGSPRQATAQKTEVDRGRYLVEELAKCAECHTPRDASGNLDPNAWLQGAPIWITPVRPIQNWADRAPDLSGLPSFTNEEMERVLEKGTGPEGEVLRPPMHIYHMNSADAKAIIAYLKSLPLQKH